MEKPRERVLEVHLNILVPFHKVYEEIHIFFLFLCLLHILIAFYLLDSVDFIYGLRNNTEATSHWSE